ncbi:protein of unknown function (plasmid) [Caballeronia sp. S22]
MIALFTHKYIKPPLTALLTPAAAPGSPSFGFRFEEFCSIADDNDAKLENPVASEVIIAS